MKIFSHQLLNFFCKLFMAKSLFFLLALTSFACGFLSSAFKIVFHVDLAIINSCRLSKCLIFVWLNFSLEFFLLLSLLLLLRRLFVLHFVDLFRRRSSDDERLNLMKITEETKLNWMQMMRTKSAERKENGFQPQNFVRRPTGEREIVLLRIYQCLYSSRRSIHQFNLSNRDPYNSTPMKEKTNVHTHTHTTDSKLKWNWRSDVKLSECNERKVKNFLLLVNFKSTCNFLVDLTELNQTKGTKKKWNWNERIQLVQHHFVYSTFICCVAEDNFTTFSIRTDKTKETRIEEMNNNEWK